MEEKDRPGAGIHNQEDAEAAGGRVYDIDPDATDAVGPADADTAIDDAGDAEQRPAFSREEILDRFAEKNSAIGALQKEKTALETQVKENKDRWLRTAAEFENYRKRTAKEWELLKQQSRTEVILEVLGSLDDFERAFAAVEPGTETEFIRGVRLIYNNLLQVLQKMGVAEVDAFHQPFDPTRHMAIGQIETDETASGTVAQVITKGYIFNGSVIRPAHVIVAK